VRKNRQHAFEAEAILWELEIIGPQVDVARSSRPRSSSSQHGADVNLRTNDLKFPKDRFGLEGVLTILPHAGGRR